MPILNPPHPGEFIRTEIIEPLGLSVTAAAEVLGVSRPALSNLLNAKADLSGEMALRIEKAFGPKMDTSMRSLHTMLPAPASARARFASAAIAQRRQWHRERCRTPAGFMNWHLGRSHVEGGVCSGYLRVAFG